MTRILVIDDDEDIREALKDTLEGERFKVLLANNGKEALAVLAQDTDFRLIILDMMMPVMNGEEFLAEYRKKQEWKSLPILVMSAGERYDERAYALGARCFLRKPLDLRVLIREVQTCIATPGPRKTCFIS